MSSGTDYITIDKETSEIIWHPRLSFYNIKSIDKMAGYGYKELNTFYLDNEFPSGVNMEMDEVIKVTLYCNFHFQSFPFDDQKCDLSLYDAIYTKETTVLNATTNGGDSDLCYKEKQCKWFHENEWIFLPEQYGIPYIIKMKYKDTNNVRFTFNFHINNYLG